MEYLNAVAYTFDSCVSDFHIPFDDDDDDAGEVDPQLAAQAQDQGNREDTCGICVQRLERRIAIIPCGHSTYCEDCVAILQAQAVDSPAVCPTCRREITGTLRVHL